MSLPTDPTSNAAQVEPTTDETRSAETASPHPRGYTLADEELERLAAKSASGDVLDPIALNDPVGQSVERVILRVGVTVVIVLVAGILLAQIACKNIQLSGIPDFSTASVTGERVQDALRSGITWGGEVVRFPEESSAVFNLQEGVVSVEATDVSSRTMEQLTAAAQTQAVALAMNLFRDEAVQTVVYAVSALVDPETGAFSTDADGDSRGVVLTVTWQRDAEDPDLFSCTVEGFDPVETSVRAEIGE